MKKILVCRVAPMDKYQGVPSMPMSGAGSYVGEKGFGYEIFNFAPSGGVYYGFVQPPGPTPGGIDITNRLGAPIGASHVGHIEVVWVAEDASTKELRIVGWYSDATVFRKIQQVPAAVPHVLPNGATAQYFVRSQHAYLIDPHKRSFKVPKAASDGEGFGQSNIWYPDTKWSARISAYLSKPGV